VGGCDEVGWEDVTKVRWEDETRVRWKNVMQVRGTYMPQWEVRTLLLCLLLLYCTESVKHLEWNCVLTKQGMN